MDVYKIEKILRKGGSSLAESLHAYWPALSDTDDDISERNITLHLGHELIKAGFDVYAEHKFEMKGTESPSLDLLALNYKEETQLQIKAKVDLDNDDIHQDLMDSDNTTIDLIHQDLKKIKSFKLTDSDYDYEEKFGIIICTSRDSAFIKWWENPKVESIKNPDALTKKKKEINQLINHSNDEDNEEDDCLSGTYTLKHSEIGRENEEGCAIHGMQYLIFDLNSKKIKKLLP